MGNISIYVCIIFAIEGNTEFWHIFYNIYKYMKNGITQENSVSKFTFNPCNGLSNSVMAKILKFICDKMISP